MSSYNHAFTKAAQWSMADEILFKVIRISSKANKEIIQNTNGQMLEVVWLLFNFLRFSRIHRSVILGDTLKFCNNDCFCISSCVI